MVANPSSIMQLLQGIFPFSGLDHETVKELALLLKKNSFPAGVELYTEQSEANALYFILTGEVEIRRTDSDSEQLLAVLKAGDHFGEDTLTNFHHCQTKAVTKNRVILIRLEREDLKDAYVIAPVLRRLFLLFRRTYQLQLKLAFPWHRTEETVYLISRRHPIILWLRVLPILIVTLAGYGGLMSIAFNALYGPEVWLVLAFIFLGSGCLFGAWVALEWSNDYFILTRDRVLIQKLMIGFFESRQETPMSAILSTGLNASFAGRVFGFGAVTARAYTGDLRFNNLPDPDLILACLEHRRQSLQIEQRREEQAKMHSMLKNRLAPEGARITRPVPVSRNEGLHINYYTGKFSDLLAKFFGLRKEDDGDIIYRTHWWVLLKRTILPILFLLLVLGIVAAGFVGRIGLDPATISLIGLAGIVIGSLWWLYNFIDWRNDIYVISGDQLIDINRRPLGSEEKRSAPVKNIQTVQYKRNGIIGLVLNFGTVRVQIGNEELTFDNVYNPSVVQVEIFEHLRVFNENTRHMEQERMVDWFAHYDDIKNGEEHGTNDDESPKNG